MSRRPAPLRSEKRGLLVWFVLLLVPVGAWPMGTTAAEPGREPTKEPPEAATAAFRQGVVAYRNGDLDARQSV